MERNIFYFNTPSRRSIKIARLRLLTLIASVLKMGEDTIISNYDLTTYKEDRKVFNKHLGRGNKIANESKDAQKKEEEEEKIVACELVMDLDKQHGEGASGYGLLLGEFKAVGGLTEHVVLRGPNIGKCNYKQEWSKSAMNYLYTTTLIYYSSSISYIMLQQNTSIQITVGSGTVRWGRTSLSQTSFGRQQGYH